MARSSPTWSRAARAQPPVAEISRERLPRSWWADFRTGLLTNVLNPKVALFFLAFLPQFVDVSRGEVTGQLLALGLVFVALGVASDGLYALAAGTAGRSQMALRAELDRRGLAYDSFWIVNAVRVTADRDTMLALARRAEIDRVLAPRVYRVPEPRADLDGSHTRAIEWNILRIRAPEVWSEFGVRGEGVVVANIDSGVQYNHSSLVLQYRGYLGGGQFDHNYNWTDPSRGCGTNPPGEPP